MPCTCRIETACTSTLRVLKNKVTVSNCTGLVSLNMQLMQKWTSSDKSLGAGYRVVENGCNSDQIVHIHVLHPCEISFASSNWKLNSCAREKLAQGFHNGLTFAAGCLLSNRWHLMACRFGESLVTSTFSDVWVAHLASKDVTIRLNRLEHLGWTSGRVLNQNDFCRCCLLSAKLEWTIGFVRETDCLMEIGFLGPDLKDACFRHSANGPAIWLASRPRLGSSIGLQEEIAVLEVASPIAFYSPQNCVGFLFLDLHPPGVSASSSSSSSASSSSTLSHTQLCHTKLCHMHIVTYNFVTHNLVTHTNCHTHTTLSHNFITYKLSHTQLCHTPSSFTHHLSHTSLSHTFFHTSLSHTVFHTPLCHTKLCHTPSFTHNFATHHLSHTHTQFCHRQFVYPSLPVPLELFVLLIGRSWLVGLSGPLILPMRDPELTWLWNYLR